IAEQKNLRRRRWSLGTGQTCMLGTMPRRSQAQRHNTQSRQSYMGHGLPPICIRPAIRFIANTPLATKVGVVSSVVVRAIPSKKSRDERDRTRRIGLGGGRERPRGCRTAEQRGKKPQSSAPDPFVMSPYELLRSTMQAPPARRMSAQRLVALSNV